MGSKMDDPTRRAQLERIMERRRREGRSSAAGSTAGGRLAPASFPPADPGAGAPNNRVTAALAELSAAQDHQTRQQEQQSRAAGGLAHQQEQLAQKQRELEAREAQLRSAEEEQHRVQAEVLRQVEVQKSIAAASESQLLWQQQQLEQQLHTTQKDAAQPPSQEDVLRNRLAEREARLAAKLAQQQGAGAAAAGQSADGGTPRAGGSYARTREQELEERLEQAEEENSELRRRLGSDEGSRSRNAGALIERFEERLRQRSPSPARRLHGAHPPQPAAASAADPPIFDFSAAGVGSSDLPPPRAAPTPPRARPLPPAHTAANGYTQQPAGRAPARIHSETPQDHMLMKPHAYVEHPVWDPQRGSGGAGPQDPQQRGQVGTPPAPYMGPMQGQYADPAGSPQRYPTGAPTAGAFTQPGLPAASGMPFGPAGAGRPMSVLEQTELREQQSAGGVVPAQFGAAAAAAPPPTQQQYNPHDPYYGTQQPRAAPQQQARPGARPFNLSEALNDLKAGDWFIKWTKTDKPHLRWFWLSWKKMMLFWSNTRNASMLMANNIRLEEVVSLRCEQLTEEVPEDPGRPQIYYMICIKTYKRQLNIASRTREKFDKWFAVLDRLTRDYREANERAYQQPHPALQRVLAQPSMQQRVGQLSAAD